MSVFPNQTEERFSTPSPTMTFPSDSAFLQLLRILPNVRLYLSEECCNLYTPLKHILRLLALPDIFFTDFRVEFHFIFKV